MKLKPDRRLRRMAVSVVAMTLFINPAQACRMHAQLKVDDVRFADAVVVGRITHYRIVRDVAFRKSMLANPKLSPDMRKFYSGKNGLIGDYARFDIRVDRVLAGSVLARIAATWDNSTFGEPDHLPRGPYLIALRRTVSPLPPLRGPSATVSANPEPNVLTVLQAPCAPPFLFEAASSEARSVEAALGNASR